ncbi:MAG: hypothetical protein A2896_02415 [Candidatus Nealsonbacteria bacterium RIFCSPLOWO2_01_FULL_43_32]|uniref:Penicillin-binding protein transpeptidase domain-containing protein n=1 Tax=Candidatus Nealsonbacteria bacterium RIFCSPLOWO2_01_FULL_43_32 TaxID=1801672 RepID=A0A1G2EH80_9BACT|nr:MAG: hypothetical protein A2896_02415 [Candidatus Nealsonbacteria bacterium RIFCSPLOWO2_01_FULL_43_32]
MQHWRVNLILALIFFCAAIILRQLVVLQIINHDLYAALAQGQQKTLVSTQGDRGKIFFQNHDLPVATTQVFVSAYLSPKEIPAEERSETVQILSEVLNLDKASLMAEAGKDSLYELIKKRLSQEELDSLQAKKLTGLHFSEERVRYYPYGDFASHLLGFVNEQGQGQYGLEEYFNALLQGKEKLLQGEKGPLGYLFSLGEGLADSSGSDLTLTVDYHIQYLAEKLLKQARTDLKIEGGDIIVMEPASGKILALANFPNFNPNEYFQEKDFQVFQNDAIQKIFEPGSVFKPITMAAALDKGKITPQTTYFDQGCLNISTYRVCNYEGRTYPGELTMTNVLEKSINTGAVFAERQVGDKSFLDYVEKFGIFEKTGVDLAGEISPLNTEFKQGREINFATASFGQGIEMTPLQLVRAFAAIANGGKLVKPYLLTTNEPEISDNVISAQTASKLTTMLVSVVENGFGKAAAIPGYYIAGKTGTAQISFAALGMDKRGYSDKTWQSFIGFAPAFDPRFLILVKLDNPATKTAEYSAVPLFQTLAKYIIDYEQIPPDHVQ